MSFEPRDYLRHILIEAEFLLDRSAPLTLHTFRTDSTVQRAFVRSLEVIGEASTKVPTDFHDYFGVDYDLVWDVVRNRIPELRRQVAAILEA